jgi:hypothetical protein
MDARRKNPFRVGGVKNLFGQLPLSNMIITHNQLHRSFLDIK